MFGAFVAASFGVFVAASGVARPISGPWPQAFPAKELCSNCGLCKSSVGVASVTKACAFIGDGMSRAEALEEEVHGRGRRYDAERGDLDEAHFVVHDDILLARGFLSNAQWTGAEPPTHTLQPPDAHVWGDLR